MRWQPFLTFRVAYPYRRVTELPGRKAATVRHRQPIASQLSVSGTTDCAKCAGVKYRHVHKVFDTPEALLAGAMQCAKEIAAKQAVHYARHHSVDDALKQMGWLQGAIWSNQHLREAVTAMKDKCAGSFPDLAVLQYFNEKGL